MSNPWSVKGIDPKAREAAREAARRRGMTVGEYINEKLLGDGETMELERPMADSPAPRPSPPESITEEWSVGGGSETQRVANVLDRLRQRIDESERRQALQMTGLDRSVLGLAARVDDAEALASQAQADMQRALEAIDTAAGALEEKASRAETTAASLAHNHQQANAQILARIADAERAAQQNAAAANEAARTIAESAANEAINAQRRLEQRFEEGQTALRLALSENLEAVRGSQAVLAEKVNQVTAQTRAELGTVVSELRAGQREMTERIATIDNTHTHVVGAALSGVQVNQEKLVQRLAQVEAEADRKAQEHAQALDARLSAIEQSAREAQASLRMGATAAINRVAAAHTELQKRVESLDSTTREALAATADGIKQSHEDVLARLERMEKDPVRAQERSALQMLDAKITGLAASVRDQRDRVRDEFESLRTKPTGPTQEQLVEAVETQIAPRIRSVEEMISSLAERMSKAESTANDAFRSLESSIESIAGDDAAERAREEAAAFRSMIEGRMDTMAASMSEMVGHVRAEFEQRVNEADKGGSEEVETALADINRRIAAAERRQAHTIEAISIEIKRMSETVDRRLRTLETRNDDAITAAMRDEIGRLAQTLEARVSEIEQRELAASERLGAELGRLAERFDDRFEGVERRSAEAIEHVGEQVARMAERFMHRQDQMASDINERLASNEERANARMGDSFDVLAKRLTDIDERSAAALSPLQNAMSSMAERLQSLEDEGVPPVRAEKTPTSALPAASPIDTDAPPIVLRNIKPLNDEIADIAPPPLLSGDDDIFPWDDAAATKPAASPHSAAPKEPTPANGANNATQNKSAAPAPKGSAKDDYLAAARRAAMGAGVGDTKPAKPTLKGPAPSVKPQKAERQAAPTPVAGLKGPSRIVLWSAAGAVAVAIAGGAFYVNQRTGEPIDSPVAKTQIPPPPLEQAAADTGETTVEGATEGALGAEVASMEPAALTQPSAATPTPTDPPNASPVAANAQQASLDQAAQRGDAVAQYDLGMRRLSAGQAQEGIALLRRAANQGLAMAQYRLAKVYERGEGVPADLAQARQWTERAAAAGNKKAMHDLGVFYARGEGAPFDEAAAFRWFKQAAELGVSDSQFNLGVLYQQGRGTSANPSEALFWFQVAAKNGDADARSRATALETQLGQDRAGAIKQRADGFRPRSASARANGEFGPRPWPVEAQAQRPTPRT